MMKYRVVSVLMWFLLLSATTYASAVTVTIPEQVTVSSATFTLADIATITGDDEEQIRAIGSCHMGSSPAPGFSMALTPDLITMRLLGSHINFENITWQIPAIIKVTTASQTISSSIFTDQAVAAAKQRLINTDSEITANAIQDVVVPVGTVDYKVDFPNGIRFIGPTTVLIVTLVNNHPYNQVVVKLNVTLFKNVVVTTCDLQPGEMLTNTNLALERRDVGHLGNYYTDKNKVMGLIVKHDFIPSGTIVSEALVSISQVVKRGSIVAIVAHNGPIEVASTGVALQNGGVDQFIRVQNLQSKRILSAKVIDATTVEVATNH
jgi:flagella basal body P-ring formation protein FlgA